MRPDSDHLRHDSGHFGGGVELPLAFARFGGEVHHQVFIGIAEQVVAAGAVGAEIERFEDAYEFGQPLLHVLARAKLAFIVEVGLVDHALEIVGFGEPADDLVDPVADFLVAFQFDHIVETASGRNFNQRVAVAFILVRDVLHEQQRQHIILVL